MVRIEYAETLRLMSRSVQTVQVMAGGSGAVRCSGALEWCSVLQ